MTWPTKKLGELAEFKNGLNFSKDSWGNGLKIIGVSDFQDRLYPDYSRLDEINPAGVVREADYLREGDFLFVRSNGNRKLIGRSLFIQDMSQKLSHSGFTIRVRFTSTKVYRRFFIYVFRSSLIRMILTAYGGGTNINNLNQGILSRLDVPLPPLPTQRKIAAILTAYDDLIEVNKRRIALLEKMAEELYREWFVRLRFPGYQDTRFVKGVPEGWEMRRFTDLVEMNPSEILSTSETVPFVGMECLSQSSMHFSWKEQRTAPSGSKFRNRDTLFPRITPCLENGKRGFVSCLHDDQVAVGSTEFIVFREKVLPAEYIYLLSCNNSFRQHAELSMTGASGRQRVQNDCFGYFFIPAPPSGLLRRFTDVVRPMFNSVSVYAEEIENLVKTRDLLLPRLISGKLSVEDLDIQFPPSMQEGPVEQEALPEARPA